MTFREYVKERRMVRGEPYQSYINDILNDPEFPDDENDGILVKNYIYGKYKNEPEEQSMMLLAIIEYLWTTYKLHLAVNGQY